jgi:hypothetical protein
MCEKYPSPKVFLETISEFLLYENIEIQVLAAYAYQYVVNAYPRLRAQNISALLNNLTMMRAEIATGLPDASKEEIVSKSPLYLASIRGNAIAMALLIRNVDFEFKSIPFDIANTVFEGAKHIITENFEGEVARIFSEVGCY